MALSGALDQAELAVDVAGKKKRLWRTVALVTGAVGAGLIIERVAR